MPFARLTGQYAHRGVASWAIHLGEVHPRLGQDLDLLGSVGAVRIHELGSRPFRGTSHEVIFSVTDGLPERQFRDPLREAIAVWHSPSPPRGS